MQRVSGVNFLANGAGAGKNTYQDYNAATGQAGTTPNASALTALQEEIASFVEFSGLALNPADNTQLRQAIAAYVTAAITGGTYETVAAATSSLAAAVASLDNPAQVATAIAAALASYAPLASPALTGNPTAPTQAATDNSTKLANTAQVQLAIAALASGVGQTWQNLTGSRVSGTTYTNTGAKPITVLMVFPDTVSSSPYVTVVVGGVTLINNVEYDNGSGVGALTASFIVPPGATYVVTFGSWTYSGATLQWNELR
jgi:predicted Abi (CAAX) family protease